MRGNDDIVKHYLFQAKFVSHEALLRPYEEDVYNEKVVKTGAGRGGSTGCLV